MEGAAYGEIVGDAEAVLGVGGGEGELDVGAGVLEGGDKAPHEALRRPELGGARVGEAEPRVHHHDHVRHRAGYNRGPFRCQSEEEWETGPYI